MICSGKRLLAEKLEEVFALCNRLDVPQSERNHEPKRSAEQRRIRIDHIQPGKPQQNAYVERYNRTVRYGWLSQMLFASIEQVQDAATKWLWTYNHERPNMALGGITPMQRLDAANRSTSAVN